ncbi:MAG: BglG family transcription antiterminator [Enterococcus lemanii]|jgi:lichenan operon transcriptional antiterminator
MVLVNRWYQILYILEANKKMTIDELHNNLIISPQTIRKSIDSLNEELIGIAKIIQKKNEYKIQIEDIDQFEWIMSGSLKKESDFNSASKRIAYIIKRLVEEEDFVSMYELSEELEVSRGTVSKDFREMKKLIEEFDVQVIGTPNRGLRIQGSEFEKRLLHIYFVQDYFEENFLKNETYEVIETFGKSIGLTKYQSVLLPKVTSVVLQRVLEGQQLTQLPTNYLQPDGSNDYFEQFFYHLETTYHVSLSQVEQSYLSFPININVSGINSEESRNKALLRKYFNQMMKKVRGTLVIEFDEEMLFQEMKNHLFYLINRMVFRYELNDLFCGEIEKKYPLAYKLAKISLQELGEILNRSVSVVEYSYLAVYFELALRQTPDVSGKKEIAVVCSTGRGTALIIKRQLERVVGPAVTITHFSEEEYEKEDLNRYFAVFTTIHLRNIDEETPVIYLKSLFNETWLRQEWKKAEQIRSTGLKNIVLQFKVLNEKTTHQLNLEKMLDDLKIEQLVDEEFSNRIFQREECSSTVFESGIAFPHAMNKASNKIILSVGVYPKTNKTEEQPVNIVLLLAIPEKLDNEVETELLELYDKLFMIVSNPELQQELYQQKDLPSLQEWLKRKEIIE